MGGSIVICAKKNKKQWNSYDCICAHRYHSLRSWINSLRLQHSFAWLKHTHIFVLPFKLFWGKDLVKFVNAHIVLQVLRRFCAPLSMRTVDKAAEHNEAVCWCRLIAHVISGCFHAGYAWGGGRKLSTFQIGKQIVNTQVAFKQFPVFFRVYFFTQLNKLLFLQKLTEGSA